MMKQKYAVVILLALIVASGLTSFRSYRATERIVAEDMACALTKALDQQQSDVISTDTIRVFNSYLKLDELRGNAVLALSLVDDGVVVGVLLFLALSQTGKSCGVWRSGLC